MRREKLKFGKLKAEIIVSVLVFQLFSICLAGDIFVDENHNGKKVYGLPTPAASNEAATKGYADALVIAAGSGTVTSISATSPIVFTPNPIITTGTASLDPTSKSNWDTAFTQTRQWSGGSTGLIAATGRTSLGLVIGTNVEAWDVDLDGWALKAPYLGTLTITSSKTLNVTNSLTLSGTDASTLNIGAGGTLGSAAFTASTAYQAADADLTTWAGITPAAGVGAFLATPSSANLRTAITDDNGTGALLFNGATTPDFTTGITIGGTATSGRMLQGDGTKFAASGVTWPSSFVSNNVGYDLVVTNSATVSAYPKLIVNSSTGNQTGFAADTYLSGSGTAVNTGDFKVGGQYRCVFDMTKTGAGVVAPVITVRIGSGGSTADASRITFTFGAGTGVADTGTFEVIVTWRDGGSGTRIVHGICRGQHNLATTGLFNNANVWTIVGTPSGTFDASTATTIGLSFNGGASFAGTNTFVQASLQQP